MEEKKNIEVVSGDGSNLEISPVYDHLNVSTPKSAEKKPKYVVIPDKNCLALLINLRGREKFSSYLIIIINYFSNITYY